MQLQIVGPGTFAPSPFAPSAAERTGQGAQPKVGETAASGVRPETVNRVDPPRVMPAALPLPEDRRRNETLLPPDPDAPVGPPPAFDATPLDRLREAAFAAPGLVAPSLAEDKGEAPRATDPTGGAEAPAPAPVPDTEAVAEEAGQPDPDARLRARAEAEVAEVRRMAETGPGRSFDVTR
jgi:hypothetical protein